MNKPREFWLVDEPGDEWTMPVQIIEYNKNPGIHSSDPDEDCYCWQCADRIHVLESTPLTRNARDLFEALKLAVVLIEQGSHSYSSGKEAMDLIKAVLTKAEASHE